MLYLANISFEEFRLMSLSLILVAYCSPVESLRQRLRTTFHPPEFAQLQPPGRTRCFQFHLGICGEQRPRKRTQPRLRDRLSRHFTPAVSPSFNSLQCVLDFEERVLF